MKRFFLALVFLASAARAAATGTAVVRLPEKATVTGPDLVLGEIAEVIGQDQALVERLRRMRLGRAAPVGEDVKLTPSFVRVALRREGYQDKTVTVEGPDKVAVLTQSQEFSPASLLPQIKAFVVGQMGESADNVDVSIAGLEKSLALPAGKVTAVFRPTYTGNYEGSPLLTTEVAVDGRVCRVLPLRLKVDVYHPVVVVKEAVAKGDKFSRSNVALVRTPTSKLLGGSIKSLENVLGRTAATPMGPGTVLRFSEIYDPPVVKHGQLVDAVVRKGAVELTVRVRVLEDGKADDVVRVENTDSHKLLRAKVVDEKTVWVEQAQP